MGKYRRSWMKDVACCAISITATTSFELTSSTKHFGCWVQVLSLKCGERKSFIGHCRTFSILNTTAKWSRRTCVALSKRKANKTRLSWETFWWAWLGAIPSSATAKEWTSW
jgi:hypothetical protein